MIRLTTVKMAFFSEQTFKDMKANIVPKMTDKHQYCNHVIICEIIMNEVFKHTSMKKFCYFIYESYMKFQRISYTVYLIDGISQAFVIVFYCNVYLKISL